MRYEDPRIIQYLDDIADFLIASFPEKPDPSWFVWFGLTQHDDVLWQRIVQFNGGWLLPSETSDPELMKLLSDPNQVLDFLGNLWDKLTQEKDSVIWPEFPS